MAICKDCIHNFVCKYGENRSDGLYCTGKKCKQYLSTADIVEAKRGAWKQNQYHKRIYYCSECGRHIEDGSNNPLEHFPYCHCGAKMDLEAKE